MFIFYFEEFSLNVDSIVRFNCVRHNVLAFGKIVGYRG